MFDAIISFLSAMIRYSTPLLFVSLGVMVMEIAGVVNMGAEGMMIIGCLAGVVATAWLGNVWLGALVAMLVDAPALYPWRYAGKFSARAGTPDR